MASLMVGRSSSSRGRGVVLNSILNVGGQVAVGATGALAALLNARVLGAELLGVLGVSFILADLGRPLSSFTHTPSIMEAHRGKDPDVVFATSLAIKLALSTLYTGLILALSPWLMRTFHLPPSTVLMASAVVLVGSFYEVGTARLESEDRMVRSNAILVTGAFVGLATLGSFYLAGALNVYTSIAANIVANLAMSILSIVFVRWPMGRIDVRLGGKMLRYGARILATTLVAQGLLQAETLLVSYLLDNEQAGVYTVIFSIAFVAVTGATAVGVALAPEVSRRGSRGEDAVAPYHHATLLALAIGGGVALGLLVLGPTLLSFYGPAYASGRWPLAILGVFGLAAALAVPATTVLNVTGHAGTQMAISVPLLALNLVASATLLPRFGLLGAAIATASVFALGLAATWLAVHHHTGLWPFGKGALRSARASARSKSDA